MSGVAFESASEPDLRREEQDLVARMLAGDEPAMEAFADGYFPGLYRFALARLHGDSELARELVQATACKALARLSTYRGEAPLFTWLCACCRNEIRMHFRHQGRLPRVVGLDDETGEADLAAGRAPGEHPDGALARKEEAHLVHAALDLLPPHYARALEWKYVDRLPVKEIATRLRLGAKAAESLLTRARQAFREGYERLSHRRGGNRAAPAARGLEP
jgi:RNA polymerase sigma-70 factor (ECF subfamily)